MFATEADIDALIVLQNRSMRRNLFFASAVVCLGIGGLVGSTAIGGLFPEVSRGMIQIGTGLVSLLGSGIPAMQVLKSRDKVDYFKLVKGRIRQFNQNPKDSSKDDLKWIDALVRQSIEKGITE